jgi:hypothetical protein
MPIRVIHPISILFVGAALNGNWASAMPAHDWVRFDVRETATLNRFAEAS